jgi:hypothetical protein
MREAKVDGEPIQAGPDSPEVAQCPACGGGCASGGARSGGMGIRTSTDTRQASARIAP